VPDSYELVAGAKWQNIHLYYDSITVAMVGDSHSLRLIMKIQLRTTEQLFSLDELIALPTRITEAKFIKYLPEYSLFGLSLSRRDYVLLKAANLQQCSTGSLRVCPANTPLYDAQTPSCEASLFFRTTGESNLCKRSLLLNYKTPTLRKHGTAWVYHFLNKQQVAICCPHGQHVSVTETIFRSMYRA